MSTVGKDGRVLLTTHPFELFLQLFPQRLGTVMKLVLQLSVALLEALQNAALGLNISPLLERHTPTHRMDGREKDRNTLLNIHAVQIKRCKVLDTDTGSSRYSTFNISNINKLHRSFHKVCL